MDFKMRHVNVEELLAPVRRHLRCFGIEPQEERSSPASEAEVSSAEEAIGASLLSEIRNLYREYANGFRFRWASDDDFDDADERGCLELPDLPGLVAYRQPYKNFWMAELDLSSLPVAEVPDRSVVALANRRKVAGMASSGKSAVG